MTDQFHLQPERLHGLSGLHDDVVTGLGQLTGSSGSDIQNVLTSHGSIADAVTSALGGVVDTRLGTLRTTSTSSQTISELLQRARQMYEGGDREGADKLTAAAETLAGADQTGQPGAGVGGAAGATGATGAAAASGAPGSAGAGGADQTSQLAGQIGQQVGQIASTIAQSVQGLAQGLTQLPQQIMQGVQGAMQAGTAETDKPRDDATSDDRKESDDEDTKDREEGKSVARETVSAQHDEAQPGKSAEQGRAPTPPPPPERPQPAQTRPQ